MDPYHNHWDIPLDQGVWVSEIWQRFLATAALQAGISRRIYDQVQREPIWPVYAIKDHERKLRSVSRFTRLAGFLPRRRTRQGRVLKDSHGHIGAMKTRGR